MSASGNGHNFPASPDESALYWAAGSGDLHTVKALLAQGTHLNGRRSAILRLAATNGQLEVVQVLLAAGADPYACNHAALYWATRNGHVEVAKALLDAGSDESALLEGLREASAQNHTDVVLAFREFLDNGNQNGQ